MRSPDFIGIGAQKAGTSWIHACLYEHPGIAMPASKELHFFSNHYDRGVAWYEDRFPSVSSEKVVGEFSPTYLYHPDAPQRIHDYRSDVKLIVCLRDPIARTMSAYRYAVQHGALPNGTSFEEAIRDHPGYIEQGHYAKQLERYLSVFSRDQMLFLLYEDIAVDPYAFMKRVYEFVGADPNYRPALANRRVNVSRSEPRVEWIDRLLRASADKLRDAGQAHLVWSVGRSRIVDWLVRLNSRPVADPVLPEGSRENLRRVFAAEAPILENLLQRDLREAWFDYESMMIR